MTDNELAQALAVTAEVCGTDLSEAAALMMAIELAPYRRSLVLEALRKCGREVRGRLSLAAIIDRIDDGRPGPDEAWASIPRDESQSVVWTDEIAQAWGICRPLLEAGDRIAARMAFKDAYQRIVSAARDAGKPVNWMPSLGHDPMGREAVLAEAVERGRLDIEQAVGLGLGYLKPIDPKVLETVKRLASPEAAR